MAKPNVKTSAQFFEAQRFAIDTIAELAPSRKADGGIIASAKSKADKGTAGLRFTRGKMVYRIKFGSISSAKSALVSAFGKALQAEAAGTDSPLKSGPPPAQFLKDAEAVLSARWTPEVEAAYSFLLHDAAKRTAPAPQPVAVKVGDKTVAFRASEKDADTVRKVLSSALKCEKCGHVNGTLLDAKATDALMAQRKADKAVKANAVKASRKAAKAAPAVKVKAVKVPASVTA